MKVEGNKKETIIISLSQSDKRIESNDKRESIAIGFRVFYQNKDETLITKNYMKTIVADTKTWVFDREITLEFDYEPGDYVNFNYKKKR
jgi:hypothetical protein